MGKQSFKWDKFQVGVCYYPEHWDKTLWRDDLRRMSENGISAVRVAEFAWTLFEPKEGVFSFEFFDEFIDLAEEMGMNVIFCTPTAIPPVWMSETYPEILNCRKDGVLFRHGMRRHYNYNSKVLYRLASEAVDKIAAHYAKRNCIIGWQIDNELNCEINEYYSESDNLAFREFLKDKYHTLEALNQAWGTMFWNQTYTDWEQVFVPRTTINNLTNPHQMMDFKRFISESTIRWCKMQSNILRRYVKPGDFITTNSVFANVDNHRMYDDCLDVHTYDCYPNSAYSLDLPLGGPDSLNDRKWSMNLTNVRSICPHFGIMEQQVSTGGWNALIKLPTPKTGQLMLWAMNSVAHGADFISFFRWRTCAFGTEMYYRGILDPDNLDTKRLGEVKQFFERTIRISEIVGADYVAPFAIVKDYENVFDSQIDNWHKMIADASEAAIYQTAQLTHTPADMLYLKESTELSDLLKYKVLFYPHAEILSDQTSDLIAEYVKAGGILIIGARTGQKTTAGHLTMEPLPGPLSPLTQTTVTDFTVVTPSEPPIYMDWDGQRLKTGNLNDVLKVAGTDAKPLASYCGNYYSGEPALVETPLGNGKILHFGGAFTRENVKAFLAYTSILSPFDHLVELPDTCEIAVREKNQRQYLFVLNFAAEPQTVVLHKNMTDLDNREQIIGDVTLPAYGTKVYHITNTD